MNSLRPNFFDKTFDGVEKSRQDKDLRSKLIQGVLELNEAKRVYSIKQKEILTNELEFSQLIATNKELKESLITKIMEKEALLSRASFLTTAIEETRKKIEDIKLKSSENHNRSRRNSK